MPTIHRTGRRQPWLLAKTVAMTVAAAALGLSTAAQATLVGPAGATASGSVSGSYIVGCITCPHFDITLSGTPDQASGGAGAATAQVAYSGVGLGPIGPAPDVVNGGAAYAARAFFEGPSATPVAKARASADNEQVFRGHHRRPGVRGHRHVWCVRVGAGHPGLCVRWCDGSHLHLHLQRRRHAQRQPGQHQRQRAGFRRSRLSRGDRAGRLRRRLPAGATSGRAVSSTKALR